MGPNRPKAVWIMQGYLFKNTFWQENNAFRAKALLTSVDIGSMIVLDLDATYNNHYSELDSYYGQSFIFNDLNNFGGINYLFGRLDQINHQVIEARNL